MFDEYITWQFIWILKPMSTLSRPQTNSFQIVWNMSFSKRMYLMLSYQSGCKTVRHSQRNKKSTQLYCTSEGNIRYSCHRCTNISFMKTALLILFCTAQRSSCHLRIFWTPFSRCPTYINCSVSWILGHRLCLCLLTNECRRTGSFPVKIILVWSDSANRPGFRWRLFWEAEWSVAWLH